MAGNLLKPGFMSLVVAQFFGAMNDNLLKGILMFMVISGVWTGELGKGGQGIVGICFTIPFILLSGYAGQLADRHSKSKVTLWVKVAEVPIVIAAGIGFWIGNLWVTLTALIVLTCQSSFFGPAKYGMIPELVPDSELSRANGLINMTTNVAVIIGTLMAGVVSDKYNPLPTENVQATSITGVIWLPLLAMLLIAAVGLFAVAFMPAVKAGDRNVRFNWNPLAVYITTIREMSNSRLLMVMMAWGYFYLLAGIALLILPEYTELLDIDRSEASVLMGVLGISIGIGCGAAGLISGHRIEPRLIPIGALGLIVFFALLAGVPPWMPNVNGMLGVALSNVSFFIFGAGFFSGFYIIPLQSLLQQMSPDSERGRFLGTANAVSFAFLTVSSLVYWIIRPAFGSQPQLIFYVSSVLMALGATCFLWKLRGTGVLVGSRPPV